MSRLLILIAAGLLVGALAWWTTAPPPPPPPIPAVAPAPMPAWAVLPPGSRKVVASGTYPPQPPYGAAAVITYLIDETGERFTAAYGAQLAAAGFDLRPIAIIDLPFNAPDAQFEADERGAGPTGGHVIYLTLRHTYAGIFAQLTFWDPPAPRRP